MGKDRRPDLVQYRQMLATLDPMGLPLLGATLPGNQTDESDYLPTWRQLAEIIGHKDFLFLADSKASTWNLRASINHEGGIYCFPLAMSQPRPKLLSQWVADAPTAVEKIYLNGEEDAENLLGEGFEVPLGSLWYEKENQQWYRWSERWLVVCSYALRQRQLKSLSARSKRATFRPTAEQLLAAFSDLTLYLYPDGSTEISSLNSLQRQILNLMKIPESIYLVPQLVPD